MKRILTLAALAGLMVCLLPWRAADARDELKNEDPERFYILLDLNNQLVTVYEKDDYGEYTKVVRKFLCTTGRTDLDETDPEDVATPTPRGIWKIGGRERFGKFANFSGEYARYWTQIVGSVFFHSIMYSRRDADYLQRSAFNNLGANVSHGCVRLYVEDARWLYYYACPGTTIEVSDIIPRDSSLKKVFKTKMSFSQYRSFQKTIQDGPELPNEKAWVTVEGARLRRGSGATFAAIKKLAVGDALEVLMKGEVWVKVRVDRSEGYVKRGYISYVQGEMDTAPDATLLSTTDWLRTLPEEAGERICKIPMDTSVRVLERLESGWVKIAYQNEQGYVKTARLKTGWGEEMDRASQATQAIKGDATEAQTG